MTEGRPADISGRRIARRTFLAAAAPMVLAGSGLSRTSRVAGAAQGSARPATLKGRIRQGVTRGVFARGMALEDACRDASQLGIQAFDLIAALGFTGFVTHEYSPKAGSDALSVSRKAIAICDV